MVGCMHSDRNSSVELMRICMMFGIVLLHVITQGPYFSTTPGERHWGINLLSPCVEGFVFISGYFGIRLRFWKVVKLLGLLLLYALLFSLPTGRDRFLYSLTNNWFLFSYLVLMGISPIINAAFENRSPQEVMKLGLPMICIVYGWSYLCVIPVVKDFVPSPYGFAPLSFFTMMGIYVAARMFKCLDVEAMLSKVSNWKLVVVGLFAWGLVAIGFHHHNSPFSLVAISLAFLGVKKIVLPIWVSRVVLFSAPSMFAVYLIHGMPYGHRFFIWMQNELIGVRGLPAPVGWMSTALLVFVVCCFIDMVRRLSVRVILK